MRRVDAKVLITGERRRRSRRTPDHRRGGRSHRPLVTISCAGVPETLLESGLSDISGAASPTPIATRSVTSSKRTAARFSWMRSAR